MTTRRQFLKLLGIAPAAVAVKPLADAVDRITPPPATNIAVSNPVAGGYKIPADWTIKFDHGPLPLVRAPRGPIEYPQIKHLYDQE